MKDVQGELDRRNIPLKHVGIKDLRWPIALKDKEKGNAEHGRYSKPGG